MSKQSIYAVTDNMSMKSLIMFPTEKKATMGYPAGNKAIFFNVKSIAC